MNTTNPDPFGGTPDNWSLADPPSRCGLCGEPMGDESGTTHQACSDFEQWAADQHPWPPTDPDQLAALNAWMDKQETPKV